MRKSLLIALAIMAVGCTKDPSQPNVEVIQGMMDQPALKAQDSHPGHPDKSSMRVPPKGTWPKNVPPYLYAGKPEQAGANLQNPNGRAPSEETLKLGKRHYQNFCLVCHGAQGHGDGPVAAKFVGLKPPSLVTDKVRGFPDGRMFHIITDGQGVMGTYIHQLPKEADRWALVSYIRTLK